jgi:subtilisin family serine protease
LPSPRGAELLRKAVLLFASMLAATLLVAGVALTQTQPAADRYIVVLEEGVDHPWQVASGLEQRQDLEVGFVYSNALEGFSAEIPEEDLTAVRADPRVDYIAHDGKVHTVTVQTLPWGIDRIDADLSSTKAGDNIGVVSDVNAYIIDTGIYRRQLDLNVVNHTNFAGGKNTDCHGHGTHVAGTVAARDNTRGVVGVAPGAPLTDVKVIGCSGSGFISNVIAGIDFVNKDVMGPDGQLGTDDDKKPAIANLSLSTEVDRAPAAADLLDAAVRESARDFGVFYSVAAGNKGRSACKYTPARAGLADEDTNGDGEINHRDSNGIVTTAAVNVIREETGWSNYGSCVDLWAPGKGILSTNNGRGTVTMSGTSMAAAHVGGTGALYLSNPISAGAEPAVVEENLKVEADRINNPEKISKDGERRIRFVYAGSY